MLDILGITFPIFAVIALGYATTRGGMFRPADMKVLGAFAMNIALPALMFAAASGGGAQERINVSYVTGYALAGLMTIIVSLAIFALMPSGPARRAIAVMGSSCPNSAYVGFPILLLAVPGVAAPAFAMNVLVESFLIVPICYLMLGATRASPGRPLHRVALTAALDVLRKPMVLGLLAGFAVTAAGIDMPAPIDRLVQMMAAATAGIALFVIGGSLVGLPMRGNLTMAGMIVAGKLLLHPAMAAVAVAAIVPLGLPGLSEQFRIALILSAAMPMMGIYAILAQDYGHEGLAALGLFGATVGGFFTISALTAILL